MTEEAAPGAIFRIVHLDGGATQFKEIMAGNVDAAFDNVGSIVPRVKSGEVRALAVMDEARSKFLPDVPTTKEAGVDFIFSAWNAMVAPKGTPKEIVDKLADALGKALDDPTTKERYVELGSTAPQGADRGPAGLQKLVESEMARITPVLKEAAAATK